MAATRKLQGEIDRCLKKVAEGVETFEDIWKKVHNATNSNQKEKYEADLKKEIKKLQRLRDQIKSWIASAEIKDKSSLLENRRLIETQMERFKIVERETKTKAYSKEGLGAAQKMDPAQRIKDEARNWLTSSISSLQIQIDQYESEIESLLAGKKKRLDRDKQDRMDELRSKLDRHKFHTTKLETLLRLLDNDGVEADQVNKIKDDVEYYIDSSQEPDFEENEFIYDDIIGLDEVELSGTGISLGIPSSATTDSNNDNETSGSPSSITSGGSPTTSPQLLQQQQQHIVINNQQHQQVRTEPVPLQATASTLNTSGNSLTNFIQESMNMECSNGSATSDKRMKTDVSMNIKQPVKPTAVRAVINNKTPAPTTNEVTQNKINNTMPSKIHFQQQQQQQHQSPGITNQQPANASTALVSTLPIAQQHQAQGSSATNINTMSTAVSSVTNTMHVQSVIQATPSVAFAAVAKNNASHIENGSTLSGTSHFVNIPNNNLTPQQIQAHTTNLPIKSTHLPNGLTAPLNQNHAIDTISLKTIAQEAINRTSMVSTANVTPQQTQPNTILSANTDKSSATVTATVTTTSNMNQIQQNATTLPSLGGGVDMTANGTKATTQAATHLVNNSTHSQQQQQQPQHQQQQQQQQQQAQLQAQTQQQQQLQQSQTQSAVLNCNSTSTSAAVPAVAAAATTTNITATSLNTAQSQNLTNEAHIPPLLGVAPLGPSPLSKEHQLQFQMMESAFYHLPQPIDSEKITTYFHRTPVQTPSYYPQSPLPIYDTVEFYQHLSTETLFFVFYYMEGSKAQYLAAKALKKQSWRFHTKYMMWFQRHEEPKIINDDYEQGTYIYFDYEKWSQRKKEGFTFEYKYLEDKELN